jgi:hypothetical protein
MKLDALRTKRLREAIGLVHELRHTTHAARKPIAAAIRLQRVAARKLQRKTEQLERLFEGWKAPKLNYHPNAYVSDLLAALEEETERLEKLELELAKSMRSIERKSTKVDSLVALGEQKREARRDFLKAARSLDDETVELAERLDVAMRSAATPETEGKLLALYIEKFDQLKADELAAPLRRWLDAVERIEDHN